MAHPISSHLYKISAQTGESFFRLWDDWLALSVAAFCRDDDSYMKVMKHYGPRIEGKSHPADNFASALAELMKAAAEDSKRDGRFPDYLGRIYEEESITNKYKGQFFTPESITELMAEITAPTGDGIKNVSDPACGSGRGLIALINRLPLHSTTYHGIDVDLTCVHMTTLNMLLRNANSYIIHGNALSLEVYGGYATAWTPLGGEVRKLDPDIAKSVLVRSVQSIGEQKTEVIGDAEIKQQVEEKAQEYVANSKGQYGLGF